ncbi:MAG: hypothetical protein ACYDH5_17660 [Acidimicrobiales bacterium]
MALAIGASTAMVVLAVGTPASALQPVSGPGKGSSPAAAAGTAAAPAGPIAPNPTGMLDCNGHSTTQQSVKATLPCTDPHGPNGHRFYDNGNYIGHDEPTIQFISNRPGSGNNVTWNDTLSVDPKKLPTVTVPGFDTTHMFELSVAPWFSMALCDPNSYPQAPCVPRSNVNAPSPTSPGGGSAFMELQFYPPGFGPFISATSCSNTHWCGALTIDSLEATNNFTFINPSCTEPVNFAFLQTNGVPTGPPNPQQANSATFTPNSHTFMMNPGDKLQVHIFDKSLGHGQFALETQVKDLTTGQTGYMVASATNGFANTNLLTCQGTPFNFQPEYNSAAAGNIVPWAALQANINTEFEIGHFTPCTSLAIPVNNTTNGQNNCLGPYENTASSDVTNTSNAEGPTGDAPCFPAGDTHGGTSAPDLVTGCQDFNNSGDLDYDGTVPKHCAIVSIAQRVAPNGLGPPGALRFR